MNKIVIIVVLLVLVLLGAGGYYYFKTQGTTASEKKVSQEKTEPTEPTNTPTPEEVDKSKYSIEVQNGSGIEGEAGKAQKLLEDADFKVDSTANADNYDYKDTVIQAGSDIDEAWLTELRSTLSEKYTVQKTVEDISTSAKTDVIVVVGSLDDRGESMSKEETVTPTEKAEVTDTVTPTTKVSPTP
jgi:uncharacterized protein YxeA